MICIYIKIIPTHKVSSVLVDERPPRDVAYFKYNRANQNIVVNPAISSKMSEVIH